jgi:hypothetical protein
MGSGAGHDPPTTPLALVQEIVELETDPTTFAVPVHTVPSDAVPENLNWPSNEDPLTAPLICPAQLTEVEFQVPFTSDPDCVRTIMSCAVALLDDTIVPVHVPAMLVAVPTEIVDGDVELPLHAETLATLTTKPTISAARIVPSNFPSEVILGLRRHTLATTDCTQTKSGVAD